MIWIAVGAAFAHAVSIIHLKWLLGKFKTDPKTYLAIVFSFIFLGTSLLVPFWGKIDLRFFDFKNIALFLFLILVALVYNLYLVRGLKRDSLHEFDLIDLLWPIFSIGLAALIFVDEREPIKLSLALFAAGVFLISHLRHHHVSLKAADRFLLLAVFLLALETNLIKPLLELINPISLYALRTGLVAVFMIIIFQPPISQISSREWGQIGLNALFGTTAMLLTWTAIGTIGIVETNLILLLYPIILAIYSKSVMREQWTARSLMAFLVIFSCIVLVTVL